MTSFTTCVVVAAASEGEHDDERRLSSGAPASGFRYTKEMAVFETILVLVVVALLLLQASRRVGVPYPTMLAMAGVLVGALPWTPRLDIGPDLALALFIAPALLDAAYDMPPRALKRNWLSVLALAAAAVLLTTAAVAAVGVWWAKLPLAAAIALGAIVAPPDAAAAVAVLGRFPLPRRTMTVLRGESLLNDAVALLLFRAAVDVATPGLAPKIPLLALAVPGGLLLGYVLGRIYVWIHPRVSGTLGGVVFEFVATFGTWVVADKIHVSPVLAVVVYAMVVARFVPERTSARARVSSYSVWETTLFLLNVIAFLLMGLETRNILAKLHDGQKWSALAFAGLVFVTVVAVRFAWVMTYNRLLRGSSAQDGLETPSTAQGILVSWCGMRGVVTLAAAVSLPAAFPSRDLVVLSALAVVLGTVVVQGLTLGPLIARLKLPADESFRVEVSALRIVLLDTAIHSLDDVHDDEAEMLRAGYRGERDVAAAGDHPREVGYVDGLRRKALEAKRRKLADLRKDEKIEDDVFHALEQELDWIELAISPPDRLELEES
ncbi:MAG: sodium/hydrogen exchanger [Labilithrix sp.]|nr:sodium/hydrogen exchanger [Labilithrix sp.]